ncbi:MAG: glycosyltransferase [Phycisphaerae bacterium]|nr:glycosyltransferase [Phycisphaerae bacterium]
MSNSPSPLEMSSAVADRSLHEPERTIRPGSPRGRIFMVTAIFPPHSMVGVVRSTKFVKYLDRLGWSADVLAYPPREPQESVDQSLISELPATLRIHYARCLAPASGIRSVLKLVRRLAGLFRRRRPLVESNTSPSGVGLASAARESNLYTFLRNIPDNIWPWIPMAVLRGRRPARQCDVLYSSSPPYSTHIAAYYLHLLTGLPWIADFRDPWFDNIELNVTGPRHRRMHERWERRAIAAARFVVLTTDEARQRMIDRNTDLPADKFVVIPNGIDDSELPPTDHVRAASDPAAPVVLAYFGTIYSSRSPVPLFQAIRSLLDQGRIDENALRIRIVGHAPPYVAAAVDEYRLDRMVELASPVPRNEVTRTMCNSDVLLLIGSEISDQYCIATKVYEYVAARRPIFALTPDGAVSALLRRLRLGRIVSPNDHAGIESNLLELVRSHRAGTLRPEADVDLSPFMRSSQARALADLLERASKPRR